MIDPEEQSTQLSEEELKKIDAPEPEPEKEEPAPAKSQKKAAGR